MDVIDSCVRQCVRKLLPSCTLLEQKLVRRSVLVFVNRASGTIIVQIAWEIASNEC
jgi:hypothetical protein